MIENGSRSEGIPGVFQVTRVVLYAKAALTGVSIEDIKKETEFSVSYVFWKVSKTTVSSIDRFSS